MKKFLAALVFCLLSFSLYAEKEIHSTVKFQNRTREFYLYLPDTLAGGKPLIIYLHGYTGKAKGQRPDLKAAALANGYAICYPQGLEDMKGKRSWNVGYPSQKGMKVDDVSFILFLEKHLAKAYGTNPSNVFLVGTSNGGEMCYIMALKHPDKFRAIASLAGLQMGWTVKLKPKGSVPFMEIHGSGDKTSRWEGDPAAQYGWGQYLAVPAAVSNVVAMNGCIHYTKSDVPGFNGNDKTTYLHHYDMGTDGSEVLFYEVVGGTHKSASRDIDAISEIIKFFTRHSLK